METRLNITIDKKLLAAIKKYAQKNNTNISEMVEQFFREMLKSPPIKHSNIVDLVEKLERRLISPDTDLKELYYKEHSSKHTT